MEITLDKLAKDVADKALNDIKLDGKTIREWVEILAKQQICLSLEQEPFINKPCISEGVCREDKMQVLDKIRAEIVELTKCPYGTECLGANCPSNTDCMICGDHVLEILDKYRAESEVKE